MGRMAKAILIENNFLLILVVSFVLSMTVSAQEPDWFLKLKEIKVFQSSKQDVERVFENPKNIYSSNKDGKELGWGEIIEYNTVSGKLHVFYSTGRCSEITNNDGWDLVKDVVVNIEFEPLKSVKLSKLSLDLSTFKREKESDTSFWHYTSEKLGIKFAVLQNKVIWFKYSLTDEMRKLDCEKVLEEKSNR
jgi:hypothetical protein